MSSDSSVSLLQPLYSQVHTPDMAYELGGGHVSFGVIPNRMRQRVRSRIALKTSDDWSMGGIHTVTRRRRTMSHDTRSSIRIRRIAVCDYRIMLFSRSCNLDNMHARQVKK